MNGILALLDPTHSAQVKDLWLELEQRFGMCGVRIFPYPHVSFHILDGYPLATIQERLHDTVTRFKPVKVKTAGIGLFVTPAPVLYIPVVRATALDRIHRLLWKAFPPLTGNGGYYAPNEWIPHITLAVGDLKAELLPEVIAVLSSRDFHWEITLDNLTFVEQTTEGFAIRCKCPFEG